jgi:folylpolyglutamate synthase/dihydrofolate synthase
MLNVSLNLPPRNPPSSHSPPSTPVGSPSDAILGLQPVEPLSTIHIPLHFPTSAEFSQTDPTFHTSPQNAISTALSLVQSKVVNALAMKNLTKDEAMAEMSHFLDRIGVDEPALKSMNFVHLAGSKGKGSTSSYIESILHQHGFKTGLFTSPHLINPTERFRINTETVNNDDFAKYFWEVWDRLISTIPNHYQTAQTQGTNNIAQHPSQQQTASSTSPSGQRFSPLPPYFTLLTLVSFHMFKQKKLDVVVLEVGLGGKLDSTNIIPNPLVTGVTTLSMEHSEILGDTLGKIAGEKCGVFKPGSDIVVFPQKDEAWNVILRESQKVNQTPILINTDTLFENMELGIEGDYQKKNANMALILSLIAMKKLREKGVKPTYATGNNQLSQEASADLPRDALTSVMDIAKLQTFDQLATFSSEMTINHQIKSKVRRESQHDATHQAKLRKGEEVERVDNFFEHQLDPEYIDTVFDFMPSTEANGNNNINSNHALTDPEQTNNPHVTKLSKTI